MGSLSDRQVRYHDQGRELRHWAGLGRGESDAGAFQPGRSWRLQQLLLRIHQERRRARQLPCTDREDTRDNPDLDIKAGQLKGRRGQRASPRGRQSGNKLLLSIQEPEQSGTPQLQPPDQARPAPVPALLAAVLRAEADERRAG